MADVTTLTTKFNDYGITFEDFFYRSSPLFKAIFYDWNSLINPWTSLTPKELSASDEILDDWFTLKWRDTDHRRAGTQLNDAAASQWDSVITMDASHGIVVWDSIFFPAYWVTHVVTAVSTNDITVSPVLATSMADDTLVKIASHAIDNAWAVWWKWNTVPVWAEVTNFIQHFSQQFTLTQEQLNTALLRYTSLWMTWDKAVQKYVADLVARTLRNMWLDIVSAFFTWKKQANTISWNIHRFTWGLLEYQDATVVDCTAADDKARLLKIIEAVDAAQSVWNLQWDTMNMLVCTRAAATKISYLANQYLAWWVDKIEINKIWLRITILRTAYWDLPVVIDPILTELYNNANVAYFMNPKFITIASTTRLPANMNKWFNDSSTIDKMTPNGILFYKDETSTKQPNSPAIVNAYTNLWFKFHWSGLWMFKKLINLWA